MSKANQISFSQETDTLCVELSGGWAIDNGLVSDDLVQRKIESSTHRFTRVTFDTRALARWDSALLSFVSGLAQSCRDQGIEFDDNSLPEGLQNLVRLASATAGGRKDDEPATDDTDFLTRAGTATVEQAEKTAGLLAFIGETSTAVVSLLAGRAKFRPRDLWLLIQQTGAEALLTPARGRNR